MQFFENYPFLIEGIGNIRAESGRQQTEHKFVFSGTELIKPPNLAGFKQLSLFSYFFLIFQNF